MSSIYAAGRIDFTADVGHLSFIIAKSPTPTPSPADPEVVVDVSPQRLPVDQPEPPFVADDLYGAPDVDCDGVANSEDNCAFTYNPNQRDSDRNGRGNACDGRNKGKVESRCDPDGDGIPDYRDNCKLVCNPKQIDKNKNGFGDLCDPELLKKWVRIQPCERAPGKQRT